MNKFKVTHVKTKSQAKTNFDFTLGSKGLEKVNKYKYLSVTFHSSLSFETTADFLAKSEVGHLVQYAVSLDLIKFWDIKHTQNSFTQVSLHF